MREAVKNPDKKIKCPRCGRSHFKVLYKKEDGTITCAEFGDKCKVR